MSLPEFFLERIAADVRQQMAGVLALTEQLARQRLTPDAQACVSGVSEAAAGVQRLLQAAVELRDVTNQGLKLEADRVPLREFMDAIQDDWRAPAAMAGATLLVSYEGDPEAAAAADGRRLRQIFHGLIGEAMGGARGAAVEASLKVTVAPEGLQLEGRVRGGREPGRSAKDRETRAQEVAAEFGLEVALGALLARRIIGELGGHLTQETTPGAGQSLVFRLALEPAASAAEPARPATGRSAHVLVVDDNATNRMVAQALCEMFDCTCEAAEDGLEAVDAARDGRFDLILMDIKMPRMDGIAAARAIRALGGEAGGVPIVALTANADPDDVAGYLAAGMDGLVEKPMKPEHLLAVLRQAVDAPRREAAAA